MLLVSSCVSQLYDGELFFFQAEDGIRYLVRSRGLGDVYKRQEQDCGITDPSEARCFITGSGGSNIGKFVGAKFVLSLIHI